MSSEVTTLAYMAPEVMKVDPRRYPTCPYGPEVDIWAVGAILFEALSLQSLVPSECWASRKHAWSALWRRLGPGLPPHSRPVPQPRAVAAVPADCAPLADVRKISAPCSQGWAWVTATLRWDPQKRPSAPALAALPWGPTALAGMTEGDAAIAAVGTAQAHGALAATQGDQKRPLPLCDASGNAEGEKKSPPQVAAPSQKAIAATQGNNSHPPATDVCPFRREAPVEVLRRARGDCQCSGHCYTPGHRKQKGCSSKKVVAGSDYCADCMCTVPRCRSPKLRGPRCSLHKRVWESLSAPVRVAHEMRAMAVEHIPCDVICYVSVWPQIQHDLLLSIAAALLQEPTALRAFVEGALAATRGERPTTAAELQGAFHRALEAIDNAPHEWELKTLSRGGPNGSANVNTR